MTRNWYAVYTLPQRERKVASLLTRKGIKNYFPLNQIISLNANAKKPSAEALFNSFVFVYVDEYEMEVVKDIPGILNFLHWYARPAIIKGEEIEAVKQLTSAYHNIKLEKTGVHVKEVIRVIDEPHIFIKDNTASIKFKTLKVILPSLGYTMIAERDKVNEDRLPKEMAYAGFFPKRLNSFFSN